MQKKTRSWQWDSDDSYQTREHLLGSQSLVRRFHRRACAIQAIDKYRFCREMLEPLIEGGPSFLEAQHIIPAILEMYLVHDI